MSDLVLTGERTLPGVPDENYWFQRHVVAYRFAQPFVEGAAVLDAGCGEGYGLELLHRAGASRVVGADLDAATVLHARERYARPAEPGAAPGEPSGAIEVVRCELMELPLDDNEIDVTVSFQVIEHLHDVPGFLASVRRVTRLGGAVLVATPNRLTFSPDSDTPTNPFHAIEFAPDELRDALAAAGLTVQRIVGVHHGGRIEQMEVVSGQRWTDLVTQDPATWDAWLRTNVHAVTPEWFELRDDDLDASLDLLAVCRA